MSPLPASTIHDWHAHIYFDRHTAPQAQALRVEILRAFDDLELGRFHQRPVGPHPMWSYQVAFGPNLFPTLVPWLALNRGELIVLVHPNTGKALEDHRDRALWLGAGLPLSLGILH
jgi:DOPA 4,5-dioxygenase